MFYVYNNAPFHYARLWLMQSHILQCASLLPVLGLDWLTSRMYSNISVGIGSESDSSPDEILSISASLINGELVKSSLDSLDLFLLSVPLHYSDGKLPSSKCVKAITSPVFSFEYLSYGNYDTAGHIAIASEFGCDMYAKALEKSDQK